jgi:hypothetical protein
LGAIEFPKSGRITRSMSSRHPELALAKSINFRRCERCAVLLKKGRTAKPPAMHLVMQGESSARAHFSAQRWEAPSVRWPIACAGDTPQFLALIHKLEGVVTLPDVLDAYGIDRIGSR